MMHSISAVQSNIKRLEDAALIRAVRHHRRGIAALEGMSFEGLSPLTTQRLLVRMKQDLRVFEEEVRRRGLVIQAIDASVPVE